MGEEVLVLVVMELLVHVVGSPGGCWGLNLRKNKIREIHKEKNQNGGENRNEGKGNAGGEEKAKRKVKEKDVK
jgi:hypothetical protein